MKIHKGFHVPGKSGLWEGADTSKPMNQFITTIQPGIWWAQKATFTTVIWYEKPPIPLLDNDESNDCFAKKQIPADSRIQLLLNWNTVNIFLFLKGMCLKFKLEPFFFKEKRKLRISGVLQSLQERCSSCLIIERVVLHLESACGSDRKSVGGAHCEEKSFCFNKTVSNKILPPVTL